MGKIKIITCTFIILLATVGVVLLTFPGLPTYIICKRKFPDLGGPMVNFTGYDITLPGEVQTFGGNRYTVQLPADWRMTENSTAKERPNGTAAFMSLDESAVVLFVPFVDDNDYFEMFTEASLIDRVRVLGF